MNRAIFVNLPVVDLPRARAFYAGLGFTFNETFSDHTAACVVIDDGRIYAMLLTREKFQSFTPRPVADPRAATAVLTALRLGSREELDRMAEAALASGGMVHRPPEDNGFMVTRAVEDPDGHVWELFWMDAPAAG